MPFERITPEQAQLLTPLQHGDPHICRRATAFTLTPCQEPGWEGWEDVTYYTDGTVSDYSIHPLEVMYQEWKDLGDQLSTLYEKDQEN